MITSVLTTTGMAIGIMVEALLPGGAVAQGGGKSGGKPENAKYGQGTN